MIVVEYKKLWLRWLKIKNCHSIPKRIFVYWKSKKNILRSFHYTTTPIRRAMECLNVNKIFETLFTFCHLKRKCICIRNHVWEKRVNALGFLKQSIIGKLLLIMKDFNHILLTRRAVCLVVINVPKSSK